MTCTSLHLSLLSGQQCTSGLVSNVWCTVNLHFICLWGKLVIYIPVACFASLCPGNADLLKELLTAGADVDEADEEGRTALHFAAGYGEIPCLKLLIEHKAKLDLVDNNKNTALHYAAGYGQAESVKVLLER
jgi:ankyrin repeat protein